MPVMVRRVDDAGGMVTFGYDAPPRVAAAYGEAKGEAVLTSSVVLNEFPEPRGRTVFTEINPLSGRVRVFYIDPPYFVRGEHVAPEPVTVYEGDLSRKK